ncbi:DUF3613 domain-containing protein [Panacagrimonas sp.]|uniref:DUF3613 domain-containing protein n=1 Tax=Panacagrimonas sp. TaxID=2480088 RepID=UPI003B52BDC7
MIDKILASAAVWTALTLALPLAAQQTAAPAPASARDWVELQKGGTAASPVARPLPGDIADRTYRRYAESFSQPIPETLDREGFIEDGGGQ